MDDILEVLLIRTLNIPIASAASTVSIGAATSSTEICKTELNQYLVFTQSMFKKYLLNFKDAEF